MLYVGDDKYKVYVGSQRTKVLTPIEYVLFEINDVQFDGTASSVIDTGIKLWDGTYDNWVLELSCTAPKTINYETVFVCRPDYSPNNGVRLRWYKSSTQNVLQLHLGNEGSVTKISGNLNLKSSYGVIVEINTPQNIELKILKIGNKIDVSFNGNTFVGNINPTAQNLPLLIGCDYQGTNNGTQRYFKGTIYKFKLYQTI